jgi:hypothetical protein
MPASNANCLPVHVSVLEISDLEIRALSLTLTALTAHVILLNNVPEWERNKLRNGG